MLLALIYSAWFFHYYRTVTLGKTSDEAAWYGGVAGGLALLNAAVVYGANKCRTRIPTGGGEQRVPYALLAVVAGTLAPVGINVAFVLSAGANWFGDTTLDWVAAWPGLVVVSVACLFWAVDIGREFWKAEKAAAEATSQVIKVTVMNKAGRLILPLVMNLNYAPDENFTLELRDTTATESTTSVLGSVKGAKYVKS